MAENYIYSTAIDGTRNAMRPTRRTWIKHALLLLLTIVTATVAGTLFPFGPINTLPEADPQTWPEIARFITSLPVRYAELVASAVYSIATEVRNLQYGLSFALSLLFILGVHETGHYIACRIYKVDATLPYFIPTPPLIGPAGTFGAFIKIVSPMPSRKAVFDIGLAGPIAGFIALLPIAIIGVVLMEPGTTEPAGIGGIIFADPLLMQIIGGSLGIDVSTAYGNAFSFAAWVGMLVTALNLIPSGQLDGGHAIFAVFGETVHRWTGRIAFASMTLMSVIGWIYFSSPSGFLIAILLGVMMRVRHPVPHDLSSIGTTRKVIAAAALAIFILCFTPIPIQIL